MKKYPVLLGSTTVGWITEEHCGLYKKYECRCRFDDANVHRVVLCVGSKRIEMGVCVPEGDEFVMRKMIPGKEIPFGPVQFQVDYAEEDVSLWQEGQELPIVELLRNAKLCIREGIYTMVAVEQIKNQVQYLPGNDPSP